MRKARMAAGLGTSIITLLFVASACGLLAADYSDVLLVTNTNSTDSIQIADYFAQARNVTHRLNVSLPNNTFAMKFGALNESLFQPVRNYVNSTNDTINYIVLSMDFPTRTNETEVPSSYGLSNYSSVDTELMLVNGPYESYMGGVGAQMNPYFFANYPNGAPAFTHAAYGMYLVTRLDGNNTADAQGLVDHAAHIRKADRNSGQALMARVLAAIPANYYALTNATLASAGMNVTINVSDYATLPNVNYQNVSYLDIYAYPSFSPSGLPEMTWKNGSVAIERYSFGGLYTDYTFDGYGSWQTIGIRLIGQGATAVVAYPTEPLSSGSVFNYLLAQNLVRPIPYADAIWNAVLTISWSTSVYADPKATYPAITVNAAQNQSSGYADCNITYFSHIIPSANVTYQWYKNGVPQGSPGSVQNLAHLSSFNTTISLSNFSAGDTAMCEASAYLGNELLDALNTSLNTLQYILSTPNETFNLTSNITMNGTTAFNVTAPNVTIDCNGYSIIGSGTGSGVFSNQSGTQVRNCIISNFLYGVNFNGATNGRIENTNASSTNGYGLFLSSSSGNVVISSSGSAGSAGIRLQSSSNNNLVANFTGNSGYNPGIYLHSSSNNNITNSTGSANSNAGIYLYSGSGNRLSNSAGTSNTSFGIRLESSSGNSISGSNATSGTFMGLYVLSSSGNNITSTLANSTSSNGVLLQSSSGNILRNSSFSSANYTAVRLDSGSSSNSFVQNSIAGLAWINNSGSGNAFNNSTAGNAYYLANGSGAWTAFNITDASGDGWADGGSARPFNNSTVSGYWIGGGADHRPYTLTPGTPSGQITSVQILPSSPTISDNMRCTLIISSNFPPLANASIEWYRNGTNQSAFAGAYSGIASDASTNVSTVPSSELSEGDVWRCSVNAQYNSTEFSGWANSSNVTIAPFSCGNLSSAGTTYSLSQNLSANATCFTVTAANVTIDCQGRSITGTGSGYGIYSAYQGTSVTNCLISNFSYGIYFNSFSVGSIGSTTVRSSSYGIFLIGVSGVSVTDSSASAQYDGIYLQSSSSNRVDLANASSQSNAAIRLYDSSYNNVTNSNASSTTGIGILAHQNSNYNRLENNTAFSNNSGGCSYSECGAIFLGTSSFNNLTSNNATSAASYGVRVGQSSYNRLEGNAISSSSSYPLYVKSGSDGNAVLQNIITGDLWVSDSGSGNYYNNSSAGNAYYFANGSGAWGAYGISDSDGDGWADTGAELPFSSSTISPYWSGNGGDYHPAVRTPLSVSIDSPAANSTLTSVPISIGITVTSPRIGHTAISLVSQDGSTANSTVSYANGTFQVSFGAPDGIYNITATAYDTIGASNSTSVSGITVAIPPPPSTQAGGYGEAPILSSSFDCQNSILSVHARYAGLPASGLGIRLSYSPEPGYVRNFTDSSGNATFKIARDGRYSLESEQSAGYYVFSSGPFALASCAASQNGSEQPEMHVPPQQNPPPEQPSEPTPGVEPSQPPEQPGTIPHIPAPSQPPAVPPEIRQAVKEAAVPVGMLALMGAAAALVSGALAFYVIIRMRAK